MPKMSAPSRGVPRHRPSAAAAEIESAIAGAGREKPPEHVVADLRSEERRRDRLVAGVGVERLVEVSRSLGKLGERSKVEIAR